MNNLITENRFFNIPVTLIETAILLAGLALVFLLEVCYL